MMWVTADHHFGHKNILAYDCRPFRDVKEMDETMVRRWNEVVKPEDVVWHLGDFALASFDHARNILGRLNGRKHLILGNHDRSAGRMSEMGFDEVYNGPIILHREVGIQEGDEIVSYTSHVVLSHYPSITVLDGETYQTLNACVNSWDYYPIPLPVPRGWMTIHGHSHNGRVTWCKFEMPSPVHLR
jgi:calcineurin-like phosphoesterase family protein